MTTPKSPNVLEATGVLRGQLTLLPLLTATDPSPRAVPVHRARRRETSTRSSMPSHDEIAAAQGELLELLGVPAEDAACSCWACGAKSFRWRGDNIEEQREDRGWLERAHIVAHAAGGSNVPTNFLLLCHTCHSEQPDTVPFAEQVSWLRTRESEASRVSRRMRAIIEKLRKIAALHGGDEVLAAWGNSLGTTGEDRHAAIRVLMSKHAAKPGGHHEGNEAQSALWGLVDDFRQWARART